VTEKLQEVSRQARDLYNQHPDWVTFFREVLGKDGIVRKLCPTPEALEKFEKTQEYVEIQQMLTKLRKRTRGTAAPQEPNRVITIRLPESLHEALRAEAHDHHTSMNKLCISKLLQLVDGELVPADG
jgi:predicted HicB family RNase H-like nuclease